MAHLSDQDSGIESDVDVAVPDQVLSQQQIERIVRKIEPYFSDANLLTDEFMNKNVRKQKGWVNLSLVLKYCKVNQIYNGVKVPALAHALRVGSTLLEVKANGKKLKVRRVQPLKEVDSGSKRDRRVFFVNLPSPTGQPIDRLIEQDFSQFGEINLIFKFHSNSPHNPHAKLVNYIENKFGPLPEGTAIGCVEFCRIASLGKCMQGLNRLTRIWSATSFVQDESQQEKR